MNDYQNKYIEIAKKIVLDKIDKEKVTVFLFGSRAFGNARHDSDIDIGLWSPVKIDEFLISKINDAIEESVVPYHIDILDFTKVNADFRKIAMEKIILWNRGIDFSIS
ncbi:MAG: nucleotidyltransferase domain-containing protein [Ignavibacteriaceae bacterium]|nr:nucleotidyltransferase domain-containing protein [Ignavibacteriaceae bacterium]